jgi:hypothetical protein
MLLVNEKLPNFKLAVGTEILSTDESGQIEIKDKDTIDALLASGFSEMKKPVKAKEVKAKEVAAKPVKEAEEIKVETKSADEPKVERSQPHWQKSKNK